MLIDSTCVDKLYFPQEGGAAGHNLVGVEEKVATDEIGTPDPNPRNSLSWCL